LPNRENHPRKRDTAIPNFHLSTQRPPLPLRSPARQDPKHSVPALLHVHCSTMNPVHLSTPMRRHNPSAITATAAATSSAAAPAKTGAATTNATDRASALRPPMAHATTVRTQVPSSRAARVATTTATETTSASSSNQATVRAKVGPTNDSEQRVRALVLAFLRKTNVSCLTARERKLVVDISAVVRELVSEHDDAHRELHELRKRVDDDRVSPALLTRFAEATIDDHDMVDEEELEEKPVPTLWQLIAANYADDPELAAAWTGLRDDPAVADLHEPRTASGSTQVRERICRLQF
jgi:hypothetical protein